MGSILARKIQMSELLNKLDEERRRLARDGEIIEILPHITRISDGSGSHHSVIFSSLTEQNADEIIGEVINHYRKLGAEFEWKVYAHDRPADLLDRLRQRKFEIGPLESVLTLDLSNPPGWINAPMEHSVTRVDRIEDVALFRIAAEAIFGKDYSYTANALEESIRAGSTQHRGYIAMEDGRAVSIGRLYTHPRSAFGGLYGGGTLKTHRGRGFYRAVIAARAHDAIRLGARYLIVDALPTSRPILLRLGFEHVTDTWPCVWRP